MNESVQSTFTVTKNLNKKHRFHASSEDPQVADTKVCTADANQNTSFIIPDGSRGAIIFWQDSTSDAAQDIYYNKLNSTGIIV
ncbi:MAG: hypothetical protein ABI288_10885 [Ginsengibacter sp.]